MGRSKLGPSLRKAAGARLIVVFPNGMRKPELASAVLTRSRDSLTAASGKPTITINESLKPESTSTSTGQASIPFTAAEQTFASMRAALLQTTLLMQAANARRLTLLLCGAEA